MESEFNTTEGTPKSRERIEPAKQPNSVRKGNGSSIFICITFILVSGFLVLSLKDVDRAKERNDLLNKDNKALEASIQSNSTQDAEKREQLKITTTELARAEERYNGIKEQFERAQEVINARYQASQEFSDLTERINAANNTIDELINERNELIAINQDLARKRVEEHENISGLTEKKLSLSTIVRDLEDKKDRVAKLIDEEEKVTEKLAKLTEKNKQLNDQIEAEQEKLIKLKEQNQQMDANLAILERDYRSKTRGIEGLKNEIDSLTVQRNSLNVEISNGNEELGSIDSSRAKYSNGRIR